MKIGILGGGQLGRMLIQNALNYDDDWYTLDPSSEASCAAISKLTVGDFADYQTVLDFGQDKDIVSIEIEHINAEALETLEKQGVKVIPSSEIIKMIQQKILQKQFYKAHAIPSPDFQIITHPNELNFPLPFVQKTNTGGYDGKGVQIIKTKEDLKKLWDGPSVIETLVPIEKELSVIVARNTSGETSIFPVTEMVADSKLNLLDFNICPASIDAPIQLQIDKICQQFLEVTQSAGLFAIELFLDKHHKVWVNEIAPRLHNSGHQSQEGNSISQFEMMYRVLKNLPLPQSKIRGFSGMLNLVGEAGYQGKTHYEGLEKVLSFPNVYPHLYGKKETKPGRKMGHINVLATSKNELLELLIKIKNLVKVKVS